MDPDLQTSLTGGGILGRFENVTTKRSAKRIIPCDAATSEYLRNDFLKPQHLPVDRIDQDVNYVARSDSNATKFHRGFHRRHKSDIQPDAARLEVELHRDLVREERARSSVEATKVIRDRHTFNILTGEGVGRECEFRQVGKKIVNPFGCMEATFTDHNKEATNRIRNSKHRYFECGGPQPKPERTHNIFNEGLRETVRESAVIGYGSSGNRRVRSQSCGASDNYSHLMRLPPEPQYETPHHGNRSQIILG
mmetsp:Transcript_63207/g.142810  ORF Transcript_63207/g.142810 Transcript_63207/m.142810 type:complete len:251 (+) Transcript_63207:2-754(+)